MRTPVLSSLAPVPRVRTQIKRGWRRMSQLRRTAKAADRDESRGGRTRSCLSARLMLSREQGTRHTPAFALGCCCGPSAVEGRERGRVDVSERLASQDGAAMRLTSARALSRALKPLPSVRRRIEIVSSHCRRHAPRAGVRGLAFGDDEKARHAHDLHCVMQRMRRPHAG